MPLCTGALWMALHAATCALRMTLCCAGSMDGCGDGACEAARLIAAGSWPTRGECQRKLIARW